MATDKPEGTGVNKLLLEAGNSFDVALAAGNREDAEKALRDINEIKAAMRIRLDETLPLKHMSLEQAREIMGTDFLGPDEVGRTFGRKLEANEVPPIPFSAKELREARILGQFLELRIDSDTEKNPLTMQRQQEVLDGRWSREGKGRLLYNTDWYIGENFFTKDAPQLQWVLVGKDVVPGTLNQNIVTQMDALAAYVRDQVFKGRELPLEYADAIADFERQKAELERLYNSNRTECLGQIEGLALTKLCRRTPDDAVFDTAAYFDSTGTYLLPRIYDITRRRSSSGPMVYVGYADSSGVFVDGNDGLPDPGLGVVFARSR
ncbi:MAG: hypothetical protein AAB592_04985 [Patescibacteria group bacterium]